MLSMNKFNVSGCGGILVVMMSTALGIALTSSIADAQTPVVGVEAAATAHYTQASKEEQAAWQEAVKKAGPPPSGGCYTINYPDTTWKKGTCGEVSQKLPGPTHSVSNNIESDTLGNLEIQTSSRSAKSGTQTAGGGTDYAAKTTGITTSAIGTFPGASVRGLTDPTAGYSLQLNTNITKNPSFCPKIGFDSDCQVWQQFVYATSNLAPQPGPLGSVPAKNSQIYIQNWIFPSINDLLLLLANKKQCPTGFQFFESGNISNSGCVSNSFAVTAPTIPVGAISLVTLAGYASVAGQGGTDTVMLTYNGNAYSVNQSDSTLDIGQVWTQSEFNIVGNGGGSGLDFKPGTALAVNLQVNDATTNPPKCLKNAGTTGETNNLTLGKCTAIGGTAPSIQFIESN
ncbi:hypothetical protein [Burkholderia sp. TSV86]|uniref:hypothetical protein n=1 Tax=Burkholderia sp. TSV86 TaxID=1385594 RepID=UPI000AC75C74|nr:hypothetical protein [Burkholderia sp. TSV86]